MTYYAMYQIVNLIVMIATVFLMKILYDRLEVVENRSLFLAALGHGMDLVAWFSISHSTSISASIVGVRLSIVGRLIFGIALMNYMVKMYKSKFYAPVSLIWCASVLATFFSSLNIPDYNNYLNNIKIENVHGISVLSATRGIVYHAHTAGVLLLATWCALLIIKSLITQKEKLSYGFKLNSFFYLFAIALSGVCFAIAEFNYGKIPNITPIFRALSIGIYAVLSMRYHFLNFDDLARQSLMNDVGAGFVVLSNRYEVMYANEVALDLFPNIGMDEEKREELKTVVEKRELKFEKNGFTYKVTADRILTDGQVAGYTLLIVDISDIVQLENQAVLNEEAKKNLLTNISHELRTPLNVLLGASEMINAENTTKEVYKEYAQAIKVAAMNLEDTLNDILTASAEYNRVKGTDLAPYSICTLVDNVVDMCNERAAKKNIKFMVSVADDIPINAIGDDRRIRQLLLNVLSNAIRFTDDGVVSLRVAGEYLNDGRFKYVYTVKDTGKKVFKSDVNLEESLSTGNELGVDYTTGYGISLMVAHKLATALDGNVSTYSVKGKGNIYTISLPSLLLDRRNLASYDFSKHMMVAYCADPNDDAYDGIREACNEMGIVTENFPGIQHIRKLTGKEPGFPVLMFNYNKYGKKIAQSEKARMYVKVAVLSEGKIPKDAAGDYIFVRQPLSALTIYKILLEYEKKTEIKSTQDRDFVAPSARVLVVDDNSLNLEIALRMLERFEVSAETCESGYECLERLKSGKKYNLIFMDYMMEGLDGVETTRLIRKMEEPVRSTPILAYTANTVTGAKEKYIEAGMNGVIYKPASTESFAKALRDFLPKDFLVYEKGIRDSEKTEELSDFPDIEGVDKEAAIKYSGGNLSMYKDMLTAFCMEIDEREKKILEYEKEGNYKDFTVYIHGIKGLARTLGLVNLSQMMAEMEKAGSNRDEKYIKENLSELLSSYRKFKTILEPYMVKKENTKSKKVASDKIESILLKMHECLEDFEMDETENLMNDLWPGNYDEVREPLMRNLKAAIEKVDYYASKEYVEKLLETYDKA